MDVPDRWEDSMELLGKHPSHMSEIFCEGVERIFLQRGQLLLHSGYSAYAAQCPTLISKYIRDKGAGLDRCIGIIDGIVLGVVRPNRYMRQLAVYNGREGKYAIKYQGDGMIVHAHAPAEGSRHDWFLYACSGLQSNFEQLILVYCTQYDI